MFSVCGLLDNSGYAATENLPPSRHFLPQSPFSVSESSSLVQPQPQPPCFFLPLGPL